MGSEGASRRDADGSAEAEDAEPPRRESNVSTASETFRTIGRLSHRNAPERQQQEEDAGGSRGLRCCCLRRRRAQKQVLVVLRHSERRDYVDASYKTSEEGIAWPHDAPLTEKGIKLAQEVAEEMAELHQRAEFVAVASSPYRRCLETAAEVAKRLQLPVVIDQEIGEVRDKSMPEGAVAHRSPSELPAMVRSLGLQIINPVEEGQVKLFGKEPGWPETLEDAKKRYIVRVETYIRKSMETKHNMILVTHADAVAAALTMFERGGADIQNMDFCARIVAERDVVRKKEDQEHGVYAERWAVSFKGLGAEIFHDESMAKYHEKLYLETCAETQRNVLSRKTKRTKTDMLFDTKLKELAEHRPSQNSDDRV